MRGARNLLTAGVLALLVTGCSGAVSGQGSYLGVGPATAPTTSVPPSESGSTSAQQTTSTPQTTSAQQTTAATSTSAPPPPTSAGPTTASPTGAPPPSDELSQDGWVVESVEFSESIIDTFEGTARILNSADTARSAVFTFTLFVGEDLVATMIASVSEVPAGDTVTAQLIGFDPYVAGPYSIDFQVDFSF